MNCKTRGEKIDEFLTALKRVFITILLVVWGCLTLALGISLGISKRENSELETRIRIMEENQREEKKDSSEARYIILDW